MIYSPSSQLECLCCLANVTFGIHSYIADQTVEEIEKTKQFAYEVIDLLRNCPQCTMVFNKFIPAYHHHFGRQCRVADYGFLKLIELFEAVPDVVTVSRI